MLEITELLKAIAWPSVTVFALLLLRGEIRSFVARLAETLANAAQVSIGVKGLDIKYDKKIAVISSQISAIGAVQNQVTETVYKTGRRARASLKKDAQSAEIPKELRDLAAEYANVNQTDWRTRVLRKNDLALQMGDLVIRKDVSRELLASKHEEALFVALAAAVATDPQPGDLERLLALADNAQRLHVRYKIVVSLGALINKGLVPRDLAPRVGIAFERMSAGADDSLRRIIAETETLLGAMVSGDLILAS